MKTTLHALLAGALLLPLLHGCGGTGDKDAKVRLVNATSEYAAMDLYESSDAITTGVASYAVGGYASLEKGGYTFHLKSGGTSAIAASVSDSIGRDDHHTLVAYTSGGTLTTQILDDAEGDPSSGTAKLRVFHTASADAGAVDVYLVNTPCATLSSSPSAATASGVSGLQAGYTEVAAAGGGTGYHVCVTAAGDKGDLRLDIPALSLSDQQIVTLILVRSSGGVLLHGLLLNQQGALAKALNSSARMRLAAGASGSAAVTATVNGTTLGTNLTAPAVASYKLVDAGALTLNVLVGGATAAAADLSAEAGADLTLLVTGTAASQPLLIKDDNSASTSSTRPTRIRLVNGMTGPGTTAVLTDDYNNVGDGAAFGKASTYSLVPASAALARLEASSGSRVLCLSTAVTLNAGSVYTVFLLGDVPAAPVACTLRVDR